MAFHIVTDKCFLACEKVVSVVIEEDFTAVRKLKSSVDKLKAKKPKANQTENQGPVVIVISYYPVITGSGYGNGDRVVHELEITVSGKKEANRLFRDIIKEVREQHPNEGYLDSLVDRVLSEDKD